MQYQAVFQQVLILFIPLAVGYVLGKLRIVEDSFARNLSALLFNVLLPCTIIAALQFSFELELLLRSGRLIVISAIVTLACWAASFGVVKLLRIRGYHKQLTHFALTFSNFSFMGYPVAQVFFGQEGVFFSAVYSIPIYVFLQSVGMLMLAPDSSSKKGFQWQYILNAPMVAVLIGMLLFLLQIQLPAVVQITITTMGNSTTMLAMILAGLVLTKASLRRVFSEWKDYVVVALRLVVFPVLIWLILSLFNLDEVTARLPVVIAMMPVAANLVIVTTKYGGDAAESAKIVLLSTVFSLITIPLMGWLLF